MLVFFGGFLQLTSKFDRDIVILKFGTEVKLNG